MVLQQHHNAVNNRFLLLLELWTNIHIEVMADGGALLRVKL